MNLPATPARILLVEDDPALRDHFTMALREAGYEVLPFTPEEDAACLTDAPDLLLLDLDLHGASSWDIFVEWQARHPGLTTVAVTGLPNRFGVARAVGIAALMEKPIETSLLLLVTATVLEESAKPASCPDATHRMNFRYLTCADTSYWRGLRYRRARARQCHAAPVCD